MNWDQRIKAAEKTGVFTDEAKDRSIHFGSCAVSEHPTFDEQRYFKAVTRLTPEAENLGLRFFVAVKENDTKKARYIYNRIMKLTKVLMVFR